MTINNGSLRRGTGGTIDLHFEAPLPLRPSTDGRAGNANIHEATHPAAVRLRSLFARFCKAVHRSKAAEARRLIAYYRRLTR